jgi:hypothetical protein
MIMCNPWFQLVASLISISRNCATMAITTPGGLAVTAQAGPISKAWGFSATILATATSLGQIGNAVFYGSAVLALMAAAGALVLRNAPLPKKTMAAEPAVANAAR